jgi:hypothetical protein
MMRLKFLALLAVLALTLSLSAVAAVEDTPPHVFVGTVTMDGKAAPQGTGITALIAGEEKGFVSVYERGEYGPMYVEEPTNGSLITFRVDNHPANQAVIWEKGEATILDLTVDSDDPLIRPTQR